MTEKITFDQLPFEVAILKKGQEEIKNSLLNLQQKSSTHKQDEWLNLDDLLNYDPANRTKATWYSKISRGEVPYHKNGKNVVFLKSEIDDWLKAGKRKSNAEIQKEAEAYLSNKKSAAL